MKIHNVLSSTQYFKTLAFFALSIAMILNMCAYNVVSEDQDYSIFKEAIKSQSAIIRVFSFSVLPMKMVQALFDEYRNPLAVPAQHTNKQSTGKKNTASDFSLLSAQENLRMTKSKIEKPLYAFAQNIFLSMFHVMDARAGGGRAPVDAVFLFLMGLCILLPRGAIDASYIIILNTTAHTQLKI